MPLRLYKNSYKTWTTLAHTRRLAFAVTRSRCRAGRKSQGQRVLRISLPTWAGRQMKKRRASQTLPSHSEPVICGQAGAFICCLNTRGWSSTAGLCLFGSAPRAGRYSTQCLIRAATGQEPGPLLIAQLAKGFCYFFLFLFSQGKKSEIKAD